VTILLLISWIYIDHRRRRYTVPRKQVSVDYGIVNRIAGSLPSASGELALFFMEGH
jgi:hypothetical protein